MMNTVKVKWNGNRRFVAWDEAGHAVVMDALREHGGEGTGIRPLELVLCALGGCTAMDVVSILEKKRQKVQDVEIVVRGQQRTEDHPKSYERIELEYVVTGPGVRAEAVARAIELSEEKYCAVKGMFGPHVKVETSYRVIDTGLEGA